MIKVKKELAVKFDMIINNNLLTNSDIDKNLNNEYERTSFNKYFAYYYGLSINNKPVKPKIRKKKKSIYRMKEFSCAIKKYKVGNILQSTNNYLSKKYGKKDIEFKFNVGMEKPVKKYGNEFIIIFKNNTMYLQVNNKYKFAWDMKQLVNRSGLDEKTLFDLLEKKKIIVSFRQAIKKKTGRLYDPGTYIYILK